jgi:hypothetical protein
MDAQLSLAHPSKSTESHHVPTFWAWGQPCSQLLQLGFASHKKILIDLWCITEAQAQIVFSVFAFASFRARVPDTTAMSQNPRQLGLERVIFRMY